MKTKHTKGEWRIYFYKGYTYPGIEAEHKDGNFFVICMGNDLEGVHGRTKKEIRANAKLIAAAPIMLESLEHILEYWNRDRNDEAMHDALWEIISTADSAIKKATE